ncbi:unnamed protein product [Lota lota]
MWRSKDGRQTQVVGWCSDTDAMMGNVASWPISPDHGELVQKQPRLVQANSAGRGRRAERTPSLGSGSQPGAPLAKSSSHQLDVRLAVYISVQAIHPESKRTARRGTLLRSAKRRTRQTPPQPPVLCVSKRKALRGAHRVPGRTAFSARCRVPQSAQPHAGVGVIAGCTVMPGEENVTAALVPAVTLALEDLRRQGGSQIHLQLLDSQVTAVLARSVHALNMVQLSFTAVSAGLPDHRRYPSLFSTVPSDRVFNTALVQLLHHFSWTRVALLTQDGARLSQMRKNLVHQLMKADVQMAEIQSVSEDPCLKLQKLKAYRLNLFGSGYQWILSSGPDPVWRLELEGSGCSLHALHTVLEGSIRFNLRPLSDTHIRGVSGRTPLEYEQKYLSEIHQEGAPDAYLHGYAYDGVWVMAKAVSRITEQLKHRERHSAKRNHSITRAQTVDMLLVALKQTQFEGVTGPVLFQSGERVALIELRQFQATREILVGQYNTFTQKLRLFADNLKFSAQDGTVVHLQCRNVGLVLYAVVTSAAALLFIITFAILLLRMEPRGCCRPLDHLLLLGILLTLSWVPLAGLDEDLVPIWLLAPLCSVRLWVLTLGHCVGFGVLITRSRNIYTHLIHRPRVGKLSGADEEQYSASADTNCCVSANTNLWLTALYAYKGPLLGLGCFIACSIGTRKDATQEVTRESRRLALSVCAVAATSSLGAMGSLLSCHQPWLHFLLPSLAILTGTASLLLWDVHAKLDEEIETIITEIESTPPPDRQTSDHISYTHGKLHDIPALALQKQVLF